MNRFRDRISRLLEKIPFPVLASFIYAIYFLSLLLFLLFWPLRWLYGVGLRVIAIRQSQKKTARISLSYKMWLTFPTTMWERSLDSPLTGNRLTENR